MVNQKLLDRIRALKKLTPSESKIADFISQRYPEIVFDNVTSLSKKTGVSKATVVRFFAHLGFERYSLFNDYLRSEIGEDRDSPIERYAMIKRQPMGEKQDVLTQNFSNIIRHLQRTYENIDREDFVKVARMIANFKGNLYIIGQRACYAIAHLFYVRLKRVRPNTYLLDVQSSILPDLLIDVTSKDLLFAIDHPQYCKATLKVVEVFAERKAKVVIITDSQFSPFSRFADIQMVVPSDNLSVFHSCCGEMALIESLLAAAFSYGGDRPYNRLKKADKLLRSFEVYCPAKDLHWGKGKRRP
jgi:DNA-binding MurR/RpiR family transcriptional regulator